MWISKYQIHGVENRSYRNFKKWYISVDSSPGMGLDLRCLGFWYAEKNKRCEKIALKRMIILAEAENLKRAHQDSKFHKIS